MRRVLCFDPWEGLKTPAPALYPEWGEQLRHFAGTNYDRSRVEIGVAYAEHVDPPELWLLAPHTKSQEDIAASQEKLRTLIRDITDVEPAGFVVLRWGTGVVDPLTDTLTLHLDYPAEPDKAREYLLPLALRAYFEVDRFLTRGPQRKNLMAIQLRATPESIAPVIDDILARLLRAAGAALHEKQGLGAKISQKSHHGSEHISCGLSLTKAEFDGPQLPWLYRVTQDERVIRDWLRAETERIADNWADFRSRLDDWYSGELRTINGHGPTESKAVSPERLREQFASQLAKLQEEQDQAEAPIDLPRAIHTLIDQEETRLFQAIQKRPTPMLYYAPTALAAVLAGLFTGPAVALVTHPIGSPWTWPLTLLSSLLLASGLILLFLQVVKWRAVRSALRALEALQNRAEEDANALRDHTLRRLKSLLVRRNLDIASSEIEERADRARQLDYHLRELERHHHALQPTGAWRPADDQDGTFLPDLHLPAEQNSPYFWAGKHAEDSQHTTGTERKLLAETDRPGRYAGLTDIEFDTARRTA